MTSLLASAPTAGFTPASVDYWAIAPMLVVVGGALVGVLVEAFAPRRARHGIQVAVAVLALVAATAVALLRTVDAQGVTLDGSVAVDGPAIFLQVTLLVMALLGVLLMAERFGGSGADAFTPMGASVPGSPLEDAVAREGWSTSEVFPLTLLSVTGMLMFVSANDLLTMFVGLEVLSLPLYLLCALGRRRRLLSQEAALKYFFLGAFSSAFFLFGAALMYGYAGSVRFDRIAAAIGGADAQTESLLLPAVVLLLVGVLFKVGAVPFHSWTPDVYQGAPTPVTGFMAACTKAAAFGAMLRLVYVGLAADRWDWRWGLIAVAALTMVVGSVLTVVQRDVKRLLAYSSIAHAGFIIVGLLAFDRTAVSGVLVYLVCYGFATLAAFGVVTMVRSGGSEATDLEQWRGLGRRHPAVAATFTVLLLAFAGIPLTSGFTAKFLVFQPAIAHGGRAGAALVVLGVLCSAITAYAYFRIVVRMFFDADGDGERADGPGAVDGATAALPSADAVAAPATVLAPGAGTLLVVVVGLVVTILLGVFPAPLLSAAADSAQFLR